MVSKVMVILELLSDGEWHGLEELLFSVGLNEQQFRKITLFLNRYDFVKVDEKNERLKINSEFRKLLSQPAT